MRAPALVLSMIIAISTSALAEETFLLWAREARLAGTGFDRSMSDPEIDVKLRQLASEGVTVVIAAAGTGSSYAAWVDDGEFNDEVAFMRDRVTTVAHARGLKIVWYLTGLELVCVECARSGRTPTGEHGEWLQVDRNGDPLQFSAVSGVFWLDQDDVDVWLSPESPYRQFYLDRVREIAAIGADGLWIDTTYLVNALGEHTDLWPSYDGYSRGAFSAAWGHATIPTKDWADPAWRHFVRWRIDSVTGFLREIAATALESTRISCSSPRTGRATRMQPHRMRKILWRSRRYHGWPPCTRSGPSIRAPVGWVVQRPSSGATTR